MFTERREEKKNALDRHFTIYNSLDHISIRTRKQCRKTKQNKTIITKKRKLRRKENEDEEEEEKNKQQFHGLQAYIALTVPHIRYKNLARTQSHSAQTHIGSIEQQQQN